MRRSSYRKRKQKKKGEEEVPTLSVSEPEEAEDVKQENRAESDSEEEDKGLGWTEMMEWMKMAKERNMSNEETEFAVMKATARQATIKGGSRGLKTN